MRWRSPWLQFGHGCDAVETSIAPTDTIGDDVLQFGHGCDAVETRTRAHLRLGGREASIRPRL